MKFEPFHVSYKNKKCKEVSCLVTLHAQEQFLKRFNKIKVQPPGQDISSSGELFRAVFTQTWHKAVRVKNLTNSEIRRINKYDGETLFFRTSGFTFVVCNATVVSVEISDKGKRHLNKDAERKVI